MSIGTLGYESIGYRAILLILLNVANWDLPNISMGKSKGVSTYIGAGRYIFELEPHVRTS